jgi:hypothetical protein
LYIFAGLNIIFKPIFLAQKVDIRQLFSSILNVFSRGETFLPPEIMQPIASWMFVGCINQEHACKLGKAPQLIGLN